SKTGVNCRLTIGKMNILKNRFWNNTLVPAIALLAFILIFGQRASGNTVIAWGYDSAGQIETPPGLTNVAAVAAGAYHSLALASNGMVVAWGNNTYGQTNVPANLTNAT